MLRKFNKLAFSGTQSARAAANWQKEIYTTVDYDPNEPKVRFKVFSNISLLQFTSLEKTLKPTKV